MARLRPKMPISIHALREEGDASRHPADSRRRYFYPRPPRGGRPHWQAGWRCLCTISIHALREEGDAIKAAYPDAFVRFLSTPSARRATDCGYIENTDAVKFLSTPSARRATSMGGVSISIYPQISIHALREEGDDLDRRADHCVCGISIHALREEGDVEMMSFCMAHLHFYPRPPRGGRHSNPPPTAWEARISIHALREEGDVATPRLKCAPLNFYPRPPRGGRLVKLESSIERQLFLSTPSARRATQKRFLSSPQN